MKTIYIILLLIGTCINVYSQRVNSGHNKTKKARTSINSTGNKSFFNKNHVVDTTVQPRETVTEKYLKGSSERRGVADTSGSKTAGSRTFVGGIHAAPAAGEKFDTIDASLNINNNNVNNNPTTTVANVTPVAAPNDTIFNNNTRTDNSVNTNSGAIDRSGNAQFGQSNWGNSRSTVGESQWTVPPPVTASFTKEFPTARDAIWSRNSNDTTMYSARYRSGDFWITSNYNASGQRLDIRSEIPLAKLPLAVKNYVSKLPSDLKVTTISRWQVLGKSDVYEIKTLAGKTFYVNNEGSEATY
jgi:hypothetical protein